MIPYKYIVTLTNGTTQQKYSISAFCKREAVILTQADAIRNARGYELVSVEQVDDSTWHHSEFISLVANWS